MTRLSSGSLAVVFLISCACGDSAEVSDLGEKQRKEIESAVINRFNAMMKYSEAGELENILMHFDPSGPGSYIDGGIRYNTYQDMVDNYRAVWKIRRQDYGIPVTKMYVLSSNAVLVTSSASLNTTNRDGIVFQPRPWTVTTLWTLKGGTWLIHSFHQFEGELKPVEEPKPAN